jgi:hypothetical protein
MARHPLLPREYQQVEYIESTGTQWIDTGIFPVVTSTYTIQTRFCPTNTSGEQYLIGADSNNASGVSKSRFTGVGWYQGRFLFGWCNWSQGLFLEKDTWYAVSESFFNGDQNVVLNNEQAYNKQWTQSSAFLSNIKLFSSNIDGIAFNAKSKISKTKIVVNDTIVRDYIPCYCKQSNEVGMFDISNRRFYSSAASPLLYGPEID